MFFLCYLPNYKILTWPHKPHKQDPLTHSTMSNGHFFKSIILSTIPFYFGKNTVE